MPMKGRITIDTVACKGCGLCVVACPRDLIHLDEQKLNNKGYPPATIDEMERCIGCAACANMCPECAITVEKEGGNG
ncbi:4Fe-4S dicluster domain-containing protein [Eubacteriales bacterium OttesenSCG-928-N14]|nr:4Fe-4S dicluster domain-containing protein [Eubacteriales bacterium OttesenSCG-928-N14]